VSPTAPNATVQPKVSFWQRRVVEPVVKQLIQGITPEKIALTLAVGSACALFPLLGTTTLLCLVVGIVLRLNQPIIQIVNGICTPLHFPVILGLIRFGNYLFGQPHIRINIRYMNQLFWDDPVVFTERFGVIAMHAAVAWLVIAPVWAVLIYAIARPVLRELAAMRVAAAVKMTDDEPPVHPVP
jgi:uncharacterized protein (DUF2062 family)